MLLLSCNNEYIGLDKGRISLLLPSNNDDNNNGTNNSCQVGIINDNKDYNYQCLIQVDHNSLIEDKMYNFILSLHG